MQLLTQHAFTLGALPRIHFARGALKHLPEILKTYGSHILLVTGKHSFDHQPGCVALLQELQSLGLNCTRITLDHEPSPEWVDEQVSRWHGHAIDCVLAIGGGSVVDAGKALAGLLIPGNSVMDHLEGVGPELPYTGPALPFIAVPTTAGTGSEATRNAVLSLTGKFKKSFRDEQLMARQVVIDPDLMDSCPPALIAANGMDALTQLLESYVSSRSNILMDGLAEAGLAAVRDGLLAWHAGQGNPAADKMAYAALLSGITLAHVGLGSVHGLAAPLGAFFPVGHGVACGTLLAAATRVNIECLQQREPDNPALQKYAQAGRLLTQRPQADMNEALCALLDHLDMLTNRLQLPRLKELGIQASDFPRIVANSRGNSMKTNPILLSDAEISQILEQRL